jgi:hypothetical protein
MTSSSASDHVNPAGISALMQKETTSKEMEANKNFGKWLSCGIQISGTFGLHHVYGIERNKLNNIICKSDNFLITKGSGYFVDL